MTNAELAAKYEKLGYIDIGMYDDADYFKAVLAAINVAAALAALDPYVEETGFCFFCGTPKLPEWAKAAEHPAHTPECLWLRASNAAPPHSATS